MKTIKWKLKGNAHAYLSKINKYAHTSRPTRKEKTKFENYNNDKWFLEKKHHKIKNQNTFF